MSDEGPRSTEWPESLGWAAFLACSWTWCIGMFLPVLLLRDFGPLSFFAFAVPNIVGAAAMGLLLREPGLSERLVQDHARMCGLFSIVTRAFQFFFLTWLLVSLRSRGVLLGSLGVFLAGLILASRIYDGSGRRVRAGAAIVWIASAALLAVAWAQGGIDWPRPLLAHSAGLIWLTPVMVFGFALCPYLDLSFHSARQRAAGTRGDRAFILGFGVLFATMIAGTFGYAHLFRFDGPPLASRALLAAPGLLVLLHIVLQLGYTIGVHDVGVDRAAGRIRAEQGFGWGAIGAALAVGQLWIPDLHGLDSGEAIYRGFMAFYGLVFPAYVWLCMIPARGVERGATPLRLTVWAAAVATAAPMFYLGFIARETWWLAPGLAVVLLARALLRPLTAWRARKPGPPAETHSV